MAYCSALVYVETVVGVVAAVDALSQCVPLLLFHYTFIRAAFLTAQVVLHRYTRHVVVDSPVTELFSVERWRERRRERRRVVCCQDLHQQTSQQTPSA